MSMFAKRAGAVSITKLVDPLAFNVLGNDGPFRSDAFNEFFNPTNTTPPFFQVFHPEFLNILGPSATLRAVAANPTFAFAHEAPVWVPATDEVFFASNDGGPLGMSDLNHNNQVSKISLKEVAQAIKAAGPGAAPVNVTVTKVRHLEMRLIGTEFPAHAYASASRSTSQTPFR